MFDEKQNSCFCHHRCGARQTKPAPGIIYMENERDWTCPKA